MLMQPALGLLNHVLSEEDWARDRLAGFAGQTARLEFAKAAWVVRISDAGLLDVVEAGSPATVCIRLPDDALVRALTDRASLFTSATIAGSADLAETLGFVFRNIRWDVEHDLSRLLGDIVARRVLQVARSIAGWPIGSARGLTLAAAEFFTQEEATVACRRDVEDFCAAVDVLRDDTSRVEKRLARAELLR